MKALLGLGDLYLIFKVTVVLFIYDETEFNLKKNLLKFVYLFMCFLYIMGFNHMDFFSQLVLN